MRGQLSDASATLLRHSVAELPAAQDARLELARRTARKLHAAVIFWLERQESTVAVYLHAPDGGRLLRRAVRSAGTAGRFEALAVIVRFAVRAHFQGDKVGVRLPPPRPRPRLRPRTVSAPPRPAPARRATPARRWLDLAAGYDLDLLAEGALAAHGLRVALLVRLRPRWAVFTAFRMEAPLDVDSREVSLSLRRYPVDLGARFSWSRGRLTMGAQLAFSVMPVTVQITEGELEEDLRVMDVPGRVSFSLVPALTLGVTVVSRLQLTLSIGTRIRIDNTEYRVEGRIEPLLAPWRVQPTLTLGIQTTLF